MASTFLSTRKLVWKRRARTSIPASGYRGLVRKMALLNLGIILSSLAIGASLGTREFVLIFLFVLPMVSVVLWSATFAISAFVALARIFWEQGLWEPRRLPRQTTGNGGAGDQWLDGPA